LRAESLSIFYSATCIKLVSHHRQGVAPWLLYTHKMEPAPLKYISDEKLRHIRRVHFQRQLLTRPGVSLDWMIDLDVPAMGGPVLAVQQAHHADKDDRPVLEEEPRLQLEEVVMYMQMRSRPCVLSRGDVQLFRNAVWRGLTNGTMPLR